MSARLLTAGASLLAASSALAGTVTSGNASLTLNDVNGTNTVLRVDSPNDNVFFSNFYLSGTGLATASGGPVPQSSLGTVTAVQASPNRIVYSASDGTIAASHQYLLAGGAAGTGAATLTQTFTLQNRTATAQTLKLYFAADYDIAFDQFNPNDVSTVVTPQSILMADPVTRATLGTQAAGASSYQLYNGSFDAYFDFFVGNAGPVALNNTPGIGQSVTDGGGVDSSFAFGWDVVLAPNGSASYTVVNTHTAVPEPTTLAGLPVAGGLGLKRRRKA